MGAGYDGDRRQDPVMLSPPLPPFLRTFYPRPQLSTSSPVTCVGVTGWTTGRFPGRGTFTTRHGTSQVTRPSSPVSEHGSFYDRSGRLSTEYLRTWVLVFSSNGDDNRVVRREDRVSSYTGNEGVPWGIETSDSDKGTITLLRTP